MSADLPEIPLVEAGEDWVVETLRTHADRAHALIEAGAGSLPTAAIRMADAVSRRWLARHRAPQLAELDRIAAIIGRPGAHYLNVSYEWGCSCAAGPSPDGASARLLRVLDWPDPGLGRYVMAVRVASPLGRWLTLTWPGYAGVLQAVAPGRFAAALNQAPLDGPTGLFALDWVAARGKVWRRPHPTASHLLRRVFETAPDFAAARRMLSETPVAAGAIFTLAGVRPEESCVIERRPDTAHVIDGPARAVNAWQSPGWKGLPRGDDNPRRLDAMAAAALTLDPALPWLRPPVLNDRTRLVFAADPSTGAFVAQGREADGPATRTLEAAA
ncbi:MAG: hypothetical protein ACFCUS_06555 [Rubrimonas sp.]|uniref:hypothetical protein n=1 Tax=Rubrimonas sp. TaxID=2036015 RepID=UPI002FDE3281